MKYIRRAIGSSALAALLAVGASADTIHMKNGSVIRGTVVGFANGQFTVLLDDGSGASRSRAILAESEIDRIEFDADGGSSPVDTSSPAQPRRTTDPASVATRRENVSAPVSDPVYDTTAPPSTAATRQNAVEVRPDADWTNTNFRVEPGTRVRITANGNVKLDPTGRRTASPNGLNVPDRDKLMPMRPTGALIAVIGDDNDEFIFVGSQAEFVAERSGYLFLSINEGYLRDNSGTFTANVTVEPPQMAPSTARRSGSAPRPSTSAPPASTARRETVVPPASRTAPPMTRNPNPVTRDPEPSRPAPSAPPVTRREEPTAQPSTPPATSSGPIPAGAVVKETEVEVLPNIDWTNTRIRVDRGQVVRITASGSVKLDSAGRNVSGPAGVDVDDPNKLITSRPTGSLIAVIGDDNDDFIYVGSRSEWVAQRGGILFLSVNEADLRDNSGAFTANVRIEQPRVATPGSSSSSSSQPATSQPAGGELPPPVVASAPPAPKIGPSGGQADLVIQAKSDWTSTQIVLKKGMRVRISASGTVKLDPTGSPVTPAGTAKTDPHKLIPNQLTGALVAVIGDDNNDYIFIGNGVEFVAQRDGLLFLGINEGELADNSGAFTVKIVVEPARG